MIKYLFRHNKDYSRYNIMKRLLVDLELKKDIYSDRKRKDKK